MQVGFLGLLALLFIGLKLTGYIAWSWVWVLLPIWGPFFIAFFVLFLYLIGLAVEGPANRKARKLRQTLDTMSRRTKT